jgi:mannose-1-phosphate guanylyltransferase
VERFVEKPDAARARRFLRSGRYLWNGGMFVWGARRFLDEMERVAPAMHRAVVAAAGGSSRAWTRAPRLSVDYAVMERARGVRVVPLDAGWDDVGSWDAVARLRAERGREAGRHILVDSPGSVPFGDRRAIVLVGVPGVVVVDTEDALLVVDRGRAEEVRRVVEILRRDGRGELL